MSHSYLGSFMNRATGMVYIHYIDTDTDATHLTIDGEDEPEVIYTVNSDAVVMDADGKHIGRFRMDESYLWYYEAADGMMIVTGNKHLIKAEMKIFKHLLGVE